MRIDNISADNFQGKARYMSTLGKKEKQFAEKVLNYEIDGISNKKFLSDKRFNIEINSFNTKRTVHPKIKIYSRINYIIDHGHWKGHTGEQYRSLDLRMDEGIENGAKSLREHITETEKYSEKYFPMIYCNKWQKMKIKFKMLLNKV